MNEYQQREMDRAVCLYGPHRDDLGFNVNDMDAKPMDLKVNKEQPLYQLN